MKRRRRKWMRDRVKRVWNIRKKRKESKDKRKGKEDIREEEEKRVWDWKKERKGEEKEKRRE